MTKAGFCTMCHEYWRLNPTAVLTIECRDWGIRLVATCGNAATFRLLYMPARFPAISRHTRLMRAQQRFERWLAEASRQVTVRPSHVVVIDPTPPTPSCQFRPLVWTPDNIRGETIATGVLHVVVCVYRSGNYYDGYYRWGIYRSYTIVADVPLYSSGEHIVFGTSDAAKRDAETYYHALLRDALLPSMPAACDAKLMPQHRELDLT